MKNEWSLFWGSLAGDEEESGEIALEDVDGLEAMTLEDVRHLTRELSEDRRRLNQRLESLAKELELNNAKLESLKLVGAQPEETVSRMQELNEQGQQLTQEMHRLDLKLRKAREIEDRRREELTPA
jgi:chromosome segregation ATPase